ncbi:hypothetical protein ABGW22_13120, partial [Lactococcus lactis]
LLYPLCLFSQFYTKIDFLENFATEPYGLLGISLSYLAAIFAVASLGASTATLKAIRGMLAFVGIPMADIVAVADAIILYKSDINKLKNTFVEAFNDDDRRP